MAPLERQQRRPLSPSVSIIQSKTVSPPPSPLHHASDLSCVVLDSYPSLPPPTSSMDEQPLKLPPLKPQQLQQHQHTNESPFAAAPLRILGAISAVLGIPIYLYKTFPADTVIGNLLVMMDTWDAFLHFSCVYLGIISLVVGVYFGPCALDQGGNSSSNNSTNADSEDDDSDDDTTTTTTGGVGSDGCGAGIDSHKCAVLVSRFTGAELHTTKTYLRRLRAWLSTVDGIAFATAMVIFVPMSLVGSFPMLTPGWCWYPLGWGSFRIYQSSELTPALEGICLDQSFDDIQFPHRSWIPSTVLGWQLPLPSSTTQIDNKNLPLCLSEASWDTLSGGALSSYNVDDVKTILKGVDYAQNESGGLAVAILARDIKDSLDALKHNMEALKEFFPNLTIVIFENDSTDGSREAIKVWATAAQGYNVDLMDCAEAVDCKLGHSHRDSGHSGVGSWAQSKAVGDMDEYRQRVTDYILENPLYKDYSHMMVLDIDIAVSISPFGLIHSIGSHPDNAIASSGRQFFAFSQGTLTPPYDMSAFQPWSTPENHWVLSLHESWCQMKPQGDRWRNACDPTSSFLMMELLRHDRGHVDPTSDFYRVESAFNGAVVYPIKEIRESDAVYDSGVDGQRCEHIGFNLDLNNPMYVNRKWDFHVDPSNPGGPSGWRAQNVISYVMTTPKIVVPLVFMQAGMFIILCHSFVTLGIFLVYPLLSPLLTGSKTIQRMISSHHHSNQKRRRIQNGASKEEAIFKLV